jgi:hypothetical protein
MRIEKAYIHYVKCYYYKPVTINVLINCTILIFLLFRRILSAEDTVWPTGSGATTGTTSGSRMDPQPAFQGIQDPDPVPNPDPDPDPVPDPDPDPVPDPDPDPVPDPVPDPDPIPDPDPCSGSRSGSGPRSGSRSRSGSGSDPKQGQVKSF